MSITLNLKFKLIKLLIFKIRNMKFIILNLKLLSIIKS